MRRIFAHFGIETDPPHQALVLALPFHHPLGWRDGGDHGAWLAAAERLQAVEPQLEILATDLAEQPGNLLRDVFIDVPDKAERHVIIFRIDPARAGQPAAQQRQLVAQRFRYLQTGKQPRHRHTLIRLQARFRYQTWPARAPTTPQPSAKRRRRSWQRLRRSDAGRRRYGAWDRPRPLPERRDRAGGRSRRPAPDRWH